MKTEQEIKDDLIRVKEDIRALQESCDHDMDISDWDRGGLEEHIITLEIEKNTLEWVLR